MSARVGHKLTSVQTILSSN